MQICFGKTGRTTINIQNVKNCILRQDNTYNLFITLFSACFPMMRPADLLIEISGRNESDSLPPASVQEPDPKELRQNVFHQLFLNSPALKATLLAYCRPPAYALILFLAGAPGSLPVKRPPPPYISNLHTRLIHKDAYFIKHHHSIFIKTGVKK